MLPTVNATHALLRHAQARLFYAREASGHRAAQDEAYDAADAIFAAARIAPEPQCSLLFRLRVRLVEAITESRGLHPSDQELEAIEHAIDEIVGEIMAS